MDGNGELSDDRSPVLTQEAFQKEAETQAELNFSNNSSGVLDLPRGSRGPRSLYIRRNGGSFGFTLRHFIVYPPDSIAEAEGGGEASGGASLFQPMDTIFVRAVREGGSARRAGLRRGDRLIAVNGCPVAGASYSAVVHAISNSPEFLHLHVLPKEEDVLQRYYAETAYNPASNQPHLLDESGPPLDHAAAQFIIGQQLAQQQQPQLGRRPERAQQPARVQVDAASWRQLQTAQAQLRLGDGSPYRESRRAVPPSYEQQPMQSIYAEISPREAASSRQCAAPQVPLYRKAGRRSSAGAVPLQPVSTRSSNMLASSCADGVAYSLNLDASRRESSSSLSSSLADGSKGSLASYDSGSTLTGGYEGDNTLLTRLRQSFQQKEKFLQSDPSNNLPAREFYSRPGRLERNQWPPEEAVLQPVVPFYRTVTTSVRNQKADERLREAATAPKFGNGEVSMVKSQEEEEAVTDETRRAYPSLQLVQRRAREFESGRPLPEDDPAAAGREERSRSELARLGAKRLVPCVTERAHEYETRAELPRRYDSGASVGPAPGTINRKVVVQREGQSLDNSDIQDVEDEVRSIRARSNSDESWASATAETPQPASPVPLIPEPVELLQAVPAISVTPAPAATPIVPHPTQLDLGESGPVRPQRHLRPLPAHSATTNTEDKPVVVKRRAKNTNLGDDERATRRESYLKATEGGRMHIDSDLSDNGDVLPQVLRSAHRRWRPPAFPGDIQQLRKLFEDVASPLGESDNSSNTSLDREKTSSSPGTEKSIPVIKEGTAHVKVLEIDGKRASDRSWKQVWMVLRGPKLFILKDRHHQSPIGTTSLSSGIEPLDVSLAEGIDVRASAVRVADDYTKKKHVLRVSAARPIRAELLLRAHDDADFFDWTRVFNLQAAASTEAELNPLASTQRAVPQVTPATTSVRVPGLVPPIATGGQSKSETTPRPRSPTGQSPVSKTRRQPATCEVQPGPSAPTTSPKAKTWRGRVAKQLRKFNHGTNNPSSPTAPEGSTFGIPIEDCLPSTNLFVPQFVEVCTDIIDKKGLQTVGIYRVCGNNASITALTEEVNKNYDDVPLDNPRWNDLHVVSSLLKSYFRKMPDSLVTAILYPQFIKADKIEDPKSRLEQLKRLVKLLPKHNYHTLKHIILHLKRVADNSEVNRMEAKNLAIVFGPTIVRPEGDTIESMVNNMTNQCKIIESLISNADWFFPDLEEDCLPPMTLTLPDINDDFETHNQQILLENVSKYEALAKDHKEKNGALFSSIISAAQRKVKRKPVKDPFQESTKDEPITPTGSKPIIQQIPTEESSSLETRLNIPISVSELEKRNKPLWFNYATDKDDFQRRVQNFMQETQAMLHRPRKMEILVTNTEPGTNTHLSSPAGNVNQNLCLSAKPVDIHLLTKMNSASNVFTRTSVLDNVTRNSLNSMDGNKAQYRMTDVCSKNDMIEDNDIFYKNSDSANGTVSRLSGSVTRHSEIDIGARGKSRRGSSVENIHVNVIDSESQRVGSLDSLSKLQNEDESLLSTITKLIDQKLKKPSPNLLTVDDIPYADESPERQPKDSDKKNIPGTSDLYKNPSLHKSFCSDSPFKESKIDTENSEKEEDTMASINVPDNDRLIPQNNFHFSSKISPKLKRSESLNKPERNTSPLNSKLKRSESLNKPTGDKLKRSDSLTKNEKTESNINKRRELVASGRKMKDSTKNKRKNGMPDRSIKRRHTVGGTKDPDKVTWLMDNKSQGNKTTHEIQKEKKLRTSSPDLSSTRRDKLFVEITIGPVVTLGEHIVGGRPQSFPEGTTVFKVPLESHV